MLCWISKGIVNITRDEGCDGIIHGVEMDTLSSTPKYYVQVLGHDTRNIHQKFYYLDQEQMLQDFATLKDCYVSLMVGSNNNGSRVRMYNPPQDLSNTLARDEQETSRSRSRADRESNNLFGTSPIVDNRDAYQVEANRIINEAMGTPAYFASSTPETYNISYTTGSILPEDSENVGSGDGT